MKTIRMKKADHEKWDAGLRSGQYEQRKSALELRGGYCCLGVLQMVLDGVVEKTEDGAARALPSSDWLDAHTIEFLRTAEDILYPANNPDLPPLCMSASKANDTGNSFVAIADAIKECVEYTDA